MVLYIFKNREVHDVFILNFKRDQCNLSYRDNKLVFQPSPKSLNLGQLNGFIDTEL